MSCAIKINREENLPIKVFEEFQTKYYAGKFGSKNLST